MKYFISKFAVVLFFVFLCASVATAGDHRNCHFAFGNGVTEQIVVPHGSPPNPNKGPIRLRIGRVLLDGEVDVLMTEGFDSPGVNMDTGKGRITGFGKGTFDFADLGAFHTWEVDTVTFFGMPPWKLTEVEGDIRTGPSRFAVPNPWGHGFFANTDATLKGKGWMRHDIVKPDGTVVNEFTFYVWGRICDVDLKGIRQAQRN